uniref:Uncharacterized protein n=1 Tax=Anguilla anguilla TaxID=7936 RepID=A0A0E9UY21_ANGAN
MCPKLKLNSTHHLFIYFFKWLILG